MLNCGGRRNMGLTKTEIGAVALGQSMTIIRCLQAGLNCLEGCKTWARRPRFRDKTCKIDRSLGPFASVHSPPHRASSVNQSGTFDRM
jgi:hypothetical protein